ncbi:hypothetical protein UlMin_036282 [Ulmus minor]
MASPQHRCVFVGNIPYDATEEQLIEICQEVGPVVSFRLVIDRETGKPKGYGFCEYKDEETALSARRNLQGYEINGRQLRVDFAENDKGTDRNREQGRGGPGLAASVDPQKQVGGPASHGESVQHQPIGLQIAITAAGLMAETLGGAQAGMQSHVGLQGQSAMASDPLTLHLAKMSRNRLNEIMSELKLMATQNKELARQLLLARPQLPKALFQAQIMLGMATPQVLQMPNIRQASGQPSQTPTQVAQLAQLPAAQTLPGLPPLAQNRMQPVPQNSLVRNQFSAQLQPSMQPRVQLPQLPNQQAILPGQSIVSTLPPLQPHSSSSLSIRPQVQVASSSLNHQMQHPTLKHLGQVGLGPSAQMIHTNPSMQPSLLPRHSLSDTPYQPGPSMSSGLSQPISNSNLPLRVAEKRISDPLELNDRPSKVMKPDDRILSMASLNASNANGSVSLPSNALPRSEDTQYSGKQASQLQIPPEQSVLLEQLLNLTPEQLSSLPLEQQQQVIQLQKMLRQEQI